MTPDEIELLHGYLHDTLDDDAFARLQTLLRDDAEARRMLRSLTTVDAKLQHLAAAPVETRKLTGEPFTPADAARAPRWSGWRPLAAAAAGIVLGMLCTSVVFGYVMPRAVATASQLFALTNGSFEKQGGRLPSGFPSGLGVWSGDEAEAVSGASASDGASALRFVRAAGDATVQRSPANSCDVWQLVDLRGLKADAEKGDVTLELSASFLDARHTRGTTRVQMNVRIYAFAGDPAALRGEWPMAIKEAQAFGAGSVESWGGTPGQWRQAVARMILPPGADFAVVQLVASKWTPPGQAAEFGEQFADDVRLTLKTQPRLPVRITQH